MSSHSSQHITISHSQQTNSSSRRRSSTVYNSFQEMLSSGGRNSISNFASSYSRSANFIQADFDVMPVRPDKLSYGSVYSDAESTHLLRPESQDGAAGYDAVDHQSLEDGTLHDDDDVRSVRTEILRNTGNSTAPQTIFNGINTLIGIGILSLPLALKYAGWVCGSIILALCALSTQYTAKILAKCIKKNEEMTTYGDIAKYTFGDYAHPMVVATFSIDLLSAGISMIIIFADSFNALTGIDKFLWKSLICTAFFILSFVRLNILSHLSLIGIVCTSMIVLTVMFCGFFKKESPGSLIQYADTSLWPIDTPHLLLSLGIFMSPFGGHAIFPELYRDMTHPQKYNKSCTTIFSFTWLVDYVMAALGYLMFGVAVEDEVTRSIMTTIGFPRGVPLFLCALMGILPLSKGPLITRPLITIADQMTLTKGQNKKTSLLITILNRFGVVFVFFIVSLVFTDFGRIMSFLGSAICFAICVIYPLAFYVKLYWADISKLQRVLHCAGIFIGIGLAISGTLAVALV